MKKNNNEINEIPSLTPEEEALIEFQKKLIVESLEILRSSARFLITIISSLIPLYFVVLKYVYNDHINTLIIGISAIYLVLLLFALYSLFQVIKPYLEYYKFGDFDELRRLRDKTLMSKYKWFRFGFFLLIMALIVMFTALSLSLVMT